MSRSINHSSALAPWRLRLHDTAFSRLRLRAPFNLRVNEPERGLFYFVLSGSISLEAEVLPRKLRLTEGAAAAISASHVLRDGSGDAPPRCIAESDFAPFLSSPEPGDVDVYMASAPARVAVLGGVPGRAALAIPADGSHVAASLRRLVELSLYELDQASDLFSPVMSRIGELISIQLLRHSRLEITDRARPLNGQPILDERLMRALTAFWDSPTRHWTVKELADLAGMSRAAFSAAFHAAMGEPPLACLTRLRLQTAAANLSIERRSLADVAAGAGYTSENGFIRAFKREFGMSPAAWRTRAPANSAG